MTLDTFRLSRQQIIDYSTFSVAIFLLIVELEPWLTADFKHRHGNAAMLYYAFEALFIFLCFVIGELLTSHVFRLPADYSKPNRYQYKRIACFSAICLPLIAIVTGQYFTCIEFGNEKWHYFWADYDQHFTLMKAIKIICDDLYLGVIVALIILILTRTRMQKYQIDELQALNAMIEMGQNQQSEISKTPQLVSIQGDSKESLEVDPQSILYIESLSNYLNIVYFDKSDLCQKRIRSSLYSVEETLKEYRYLVHCHRAFVVNINYVTQITGNASGLKLSLFCIDKVIPVSKSNIEQFKKAVKNEQTSS